MKFPISKNSSPELAAALDRSLRSPAIQANLNELVAVVCVGEAKLRRIANSQYWASYQLLMVRVAQSCTRARSVNRRRFAAEALVHMLGAIRPQDRSTIAPDL